MLQKFVKTVGGNPHKRQIEQLSEEIEEINALLRYIGGRIGQFLQG